MKKKVVAFKNDDQLESSDSQCDCTCDGKECHDCECECKKCLEHQTELEAVKLELAKAEAKSLDLESKLIKVLAYYSNLERDIARRSDYTLDQLKTAVAKELISIIDDVNYALLAKENLEMSESVKTWMDGLVATLKKMETALLNLNVKSMNTKEGDTFDSSIHEAVSVIQQGKDGTIAAVVQQGFVIGEDNKLVRPARVVVCKAPASDSCH